MKKRIISILTALALSLSLCPIRTGALEEDGAPGPLQTGDSGYGTAPDTEITASPGVSNEALIAALSDTVTEAETTYIDADRTTKTAACTPLTSSATDIELPGGWYVVNGNVKINGTLTFSGTCNLVLTDDCKLTVTRINTTDLTIYGQENGTGSLYAGNRGSLFAIGANNASITINGGWVNAVAYAVNTSTSVEHSVIGGENGAVTINGGVVYARDEHGEHKIFPTSRTSIHNGIVIESGQGTVYGRGILPNVDFTCVEGDFPFSSLAVLHIRSGATLTSVGDKNAHISIIMEDLPEPLEITFKNEINAGFTDDEIIQAIEIKSPVAGHIGSFTIKDLPAPTITRNENGMCTATFTKNNKTVSKEFALEKGEIKYGNLTLPVSSFAHTGSAIEPDVTVTVARKVLTKGTDYTVEYANNTDIGTGTLTVTGIGNYTGTATKDFIISDADKLIEVQYVDESGEVRTAQAKAISTISNAELTLEGGWYFVQGTAARGLITTKNGANSFLILPDGCSLNAPKGLNVQGDLTIYGQVGNSGKLDIKRTSINWAPLQIHEGDLTINGGKLAVNKLGGTAISLNSGRTFTYNGTSENFTVVSGSFTSNGSLKTERLTEDMIAVNSASLPRSSGEDQSDAVGNCVTLTNPTYAGKEFTLTGWTQLVTKADDTTYTVTYTHAQRGNISKTVTLPPPCTHPNLSFQDKGDGTCGGTCPDCKETVSQPHQWSEAGVCEKCGTLAVAKAERDGVVIGYYSAGSLDDVFGEGNYDATITLLDDITTNASMPLGSTLDLNGKTYAYTGPDTAFSVASGSAAVMDSAGGGRMTAQPGNNCMRVNGGSLTINSGSFISNAFVIYVSGGTLAVTGGTFAGVQSAIAYTSGEVNRALANYGGTTGTHYAFYLDGQPYRSAGSALPKGAAISVRECHHTGVTPSSNQNGTHALNCPYCGCNENAAHCTYVFSGTTGTCVCGSTLAVTLSGAEGLVYTGAEQKPAVTVTVDGTVRDASDYEVSYADNINAGTNTAKATVTGKSGYTFTKELAFSIGKAALTITANGQTIPYGGSIVQGPGQVTATGLATGDTLERITLTPSTSAVPGGTIEPSGAKIQSGGADGTENYTIAYLPGTLTIVKADYTGEKAGTTSGKYGTVKTYDLKELLPEGYVLGTISVTDPERIFVGTPTVSGTTLTYKLADSAAVGKTGKITIPVAESTNYNPFNLTLTVTVTDIQIPDLTVTPISVTYTGSPVPDGKITGTATVEGEEIKGTWSFVSGQALTNVADSGVKEVVFTPEDTNLYGTAHGTVAVTIRKAAPELALTAASQTLTGGGTVTLTLTGLPVGGAAAVTCPGGVSVIPGTGNTWTAALPNHDAAYTFTASYAGNASYFEASASCVVTVKAKEVIILPDPPAGNKDEQYQLVMETGVSEVPDGLKGIETLETPEKLESAMKTEISKANSDVPPENAAVYDVTLMVSTDGGKNWVPAQKENFPSEGLPVTLPYPEGTDSNFRFTVVHMFTTADFGKQPGTTEVFTPDKVKNTAQGLQVVVTGLSPISVGWTAPASKPDTPSSGGGGGGGSSKPAIVSRPVDAERDCPSSGFTDLGGAEAWYHEAVDYVLEHGLMNGYSGTRFGPEENLSRAQLAQILYNKEGKPDVTGSSVFTDVANGEWFAPAITWAAGNGIVSGYGGGAFGPNDNITREQLAVMLWRYAGNPVATEKELHFADAGKVSRYAAEALRWAVENGIVNGKGGGVLDPQGLATRAQAAQMLMNFLK